MKRIAILVLTLALLTSCFGITAFAAIPSDTVVQPRWDNTLSIDYIFEFEDSKIGYAEIAVSGHTGVNKIVGDVQIYRQDGTSWTWVAGDTQTKYSRSFAMSVQYTGTSGKYYKAEFTMTVYKNGVGEVITETCYDTCP